MKLTDKQRILILGAHPDDIEFAMGATLSKLTKDAHNEIFVAVFSPAMQISQNKNILNELRDSMQIFRTKYDVYDFRTRMFVSDSPDIQDKVFKLKSTFRPHIVFSPSPNALHPDHATLGRCVNSVFQETSILVYEDVRGNHNQLINFWFKVSPGDAERKIKALKCYKSQFSRKYFNFDQIFSMMKGRGLQIGSEFAEGFEVLRFVQ